MANQPPTQNIPSGVMIVLIIEPQIGDTVYLVPYVNLDKKGQTDDKPIPGKVVYINRPHRFFTAEFSYPSGSIRESFKFCPRGELCHEQSLDNKCAR